MKFKSKNLVLMGLLLGIILFCALRDCTFFEGFREGMDHGDDDDDNKPIKKKNDGILANLAKGTEDAIKGAAKGAGTLVRKGKETVNIASRASNHPSTQEKIDERKKRDEKRKKDKEKKSKLR